MERAAGIEPASLAWKAKVLPLNYARLTLMLYPCLCSDIFLEMVEGEGFEPSKHEATDLQSVGFDRSPTPPQILPRARIVPDGH